uniref:NADH-ubiquinone oxidoreductase chain 5 n=1 Tax=Mordellidae sp. GENSP02 TaxID=1205566 RepID=A0A0S2MQL8_9CUCU|nr:NADH deshydrogenase subunit 5 [Mordellidae sp. GENSP02]
MIHVCLIYSLMFLILSLSLFFMSLDFMVYDMVYFVEYSLLNINSTLVVMTLLIDAMSLLFMSFVMFISSMVVYYSKEYMSGDKYINRFILLVAMFVLSMMLLIVSPNLISILLGWDGLGLVSYCLVVYYQNVKSYNAGMLTALTNRLGDVALLMSIAWMLNFGSWNYIFYLEEMKGSLPMSMISCLVILAAVTKSAQIPFSSWLPAAMAAPTPVSSLVHSSTLVTAGVYLLIRFNFSLDSWSMYIMVFITSMTMFMAGLGANFEFDLKKIIALSTLSQLGLMMSILFLGDYMLAYYHLLTHALFKALLFMCAGNVIHNLMNCQDIRYMGGLISSMPITCLYFNICNLSLCGLPFLSGFYSKDLIVETMSMGYLNIYIYIIFYVSIGLTVSYSMRLVYYSCFGSSGSLGLSSLAEGSYIMLQGMSGLIFLVVFMGSLLSWTLFSSLYVVILPFYLKLMTLIMILFGAWLGYEFSKFSLSYDSLSLKYKNVSFFLASMWYMPFLSTFGVNYYPLLLGNNYIKGLDQGWSEYYGSQNIYSLLSLGSRTFQFWFSNNLKIYFLMLVLWVLFVVFI